MPVTLCKTEATGAGTVACDSGLPDSTIGISTNSVAADELDGGRAEGPVPWMVARTASDTAETMRWNMASFNDPEGLCTPSAEVVVVGASSTEETTLTACRRRSSSPGRLTT